MRILHVIDKLSMDGVNPSSCTVLLGAWHACWDAPGFEMSVLSLADDKTVGAYLRDRSIPDIYSPYSKYSPRIIGQIRQLIGTRRIDLVHLHGYGAAHFGRLAARRARIKNVVHEHAVLKVKPHHFCIDWMLRNKTDIGIAVSQSVRDFMIKGRCFSPDRVRVIGNGVDLGRFRPKTDESRRQARQLIGVRFDTPVIGTITRFREEKGNADLIRAFKRVRDRVDSAKLVVIGDGELREELQRLAKDLGVDEAIRWLGFRKDIENLMPAFDIQVIPSWTEGYPLVLAEAMAVGNPLVATEVGGLKELGRDGVNVLFVPSRDPDALSAGCIRLLEDKALADKLSENARKAATNMSIESSARGIRGIYEELLAC